MAIVKMDRIAMVGLTAEKSKVLKLLMKRGFVQVDDSGYLTEEEALTGNVTRDGDEAAVVQLEDTLQKIDRAMALLMALPREKHEKKPPAAGGLLSPKPDYERLTGAQVEELTAEIQKILSLQSAYQSLKGDENRLLAGQSTLAPWEALDIPLDKLETRFTQTVLGTLPVSANVETLSNQVAQVCPESLMGQVAKDKRATYAYLMVHKSGAEAALEAAEAGGFSPVTFEEHGTAAARMKEYETEIASVRARQAATIAEMKTFESRIPLYRNLYDTYAGRRDETAVLHNLVRTRDTFYLEGWLPADKAQGLTQELKTGFTCYVETRAAEKGEEHPVLLQNNKIATPFESVTNMYSCPSVRDVDPTSIMTIFYIIFFGIMMGDAGYGLLLTIACIVVAKRAKFGPKEGGLVKMMIYCNISTTVWGFIFGSFFGVTIPGLINPLEDVMLLMGMSLVLGLVHIFTGLFIKGYMFLRDGDPKAFVFDILMWVMLVLGVCLLVVPVIAGPIGVASDIGKVLAIIGAVGVILFGARQNKNIIKRLGGGLYSLYGITSYVGDILSYTRLMALCLSSGVIAQVVDLLGGMTGPIGMVPICLIGHGINLFIGVLGAYVHTSRLQYVEFFGKFYEGGGIPFRPFGFKPKYTRMNNMKEEM